MKLYAFNGFRYPIRPRMERSRITGLIPTEYPYKNNWRALDADEFSKSIVEPCYVFGFSDGAEMASRLAAINPNVKAAFIHSTNTPNIQVQPHVRLFCYATMGDRTPTGRRTLEFFNRQTCPKWFASLDADSFGPQATKFELRFMRPLRHQFHNCLEYHLPHDIQQMLKNGIGL